MISFKQYLEESKSAPLYHATTFGAAEKIFGSGNFLPVTTHAKWKALKGPRPIYNDPSYSTNNSNISKDVITGISATRSMRFAIRWMDQRFPSRYIIFEFDQQKLTYNNEIIPISFFQHIGKNNRTGRPARAMGGENITTNEFEEFIVIRPNKTLSLDKVKAIHYYISSTPIANSKKDTLRIINENKAKLKEIALQRKDIKLIPLPGSEVL